MALKLDLLMNTRAFQAGIDDVEQGFEKVADSLDDVVKDAQKQGQALGKNISTGLETGLKSADKLTAKLGDSIGDEVKQGARTATTAVDKLEDGFRGLGDKVKRETSRASTALSDDFHKGTSAGKRDLEELKNEARQNASETFSSFDGTAQSFADGVQGTLGGIVSSLGPLGAAAGAAGALGIGFITSALTNAGETAEQTQQHIGDMFDDLVSSGQKALSENFLSQAISDNIKDANKFKEAQDDAAATGATLSTVLRAQAGDVDAIALVQATAAAGQQVLLDKQQAYIVANGQESAAITTTSDTLQIISDKYGGVASQTDTAAAKAQAYNAAIGQTGPATSAAAAGIDGVSAAIDRLNSKPPTKVVIDVDDSAAWAKIEAIQNTTIRIVAETEFKSGGLLH